MSALVKAELAATCNTLGHLHNETYIIDDQCYESVRDLIRFLRRDDESHEIRRYLGDSKIVQSDLIYIIENCTVEHNHVFDITIRLLVNLTNPVQLLYREEYPSEKIGRNIYLTILGHLQEYKAAFTNIRAWNKISSKLGDLFEIDWSERSEDDGMQIERMLVLIRNVLQIPADAENEKRVDNDISIHDQVLWGLRQSQILELLLYVSSNRSESQYFIHILEIFSLILREQNPELLATSSMARSELEKQQDVEALNRREKKRVYQRQFGGTYVLKNVKSISDRDVICHRLGDKIESKKRLKTPKNRVPEESERMERKSTFSVRLFLKELCIEFLSSYNQLMAVVKDKLVSGKALSNDESYYFWALRFFMEFNRCANMDVKHVSETISMETFHYVQMQMENCYEHIMTEKKKIQVWVKRLHIILKAYRELLNTIVWMDQKDKTTRAMSDVLKRKLFYIVEYRELIIYALLKYDPSKYPKSYVRDLLETSHLFFKLFKRFCDNKMVVQKSRKKHKKKIGAEDKWNEVRETVIGLLNENQFPEVCPFDPDEPERKDEAMRKIQRHLRNNDLLNGIGMLRSARQVWPENNCFGYDGMSVEEELAGLEEIFRADLGQEVEEEEEEEPAVEVEYREETLGYTDLIKRIANKKIVEACGVLLADYKKNSVYTNNVIIKILYRIAFECFMPSMLYQASLFYTFLKIVKENRQEHKEIHKFVIHLMRKFKENAEKNPKIYMEMFFWKDARIAYQIENGYETYAKGKVAGWSEEEENELKRLWIEFDETNPGGDKVDWILSNLINENRTRRGVTKKLKELMLLPPGPARVGKRPPKEWSEDEKNELKELFGQFSGAIDVVGVIMDRLTVKRPKKRVVDMIVDLGLVEHRAHLRKKRAKVNASSEPDERESDSDVESDSDNEQESDDGDDVPESGVPVLADPKSALAKIVGMKEALEWLEESFQDYLDDYDTCEEGFPLLAYGTSQIEALENVDFTEALTNLGLLPPSEQQVYWRIPPFSKTELESVVKVIKRLRDEKSLAENKMTSDTENSDVETVDVIKRAPKKTIGSDSEVSNGSCNSENYQVTSGFRYNRSKICIGSDSDNDLGSESSKRSRVLMNSDSENEDNSKVKTDLKRRRVLLDSDSESDNEKLDTEETR